MSEPSILQDLAAAGFSVGSVDELRTSGRRYTKAVPVLLSWLPRTAGKGRESIVRALSVRWARKEALGPLIEEFKGSGAAPPAPSLGWAIGNAIEVLWDDQRFDELVGLARDPRFGQAREMVVLGMHRSKRPEAIDVLVGLLRDPFVNGHAVQALRKLKAFSPQVTQAVEHMLSDKRTWVRREAQRVFAQSA